MPLPANLLARLQKRGIVRDEPDEEVIDESYNDEDAIARSRKNSSGVFFSSILRFIGGTCCRRASLPEQVQPAPHLHPILLQLLA